MQVNGAFRRRVGGMHRGVDVVGDRAYLASARQHIALEIHHQQVAGSDLLKQQATAIHQEGIVAARHHQAEMVAQPLVEAEADREAEGGGEVAAHLPFGVVDASGLGHGEVSLRVS